jgi:hypothetical protein
MAGVTTATPIWKYCHTIARHAAARDYSLGIRSVGQPPLAIKMNYEPSLHSGGKTGLAQAVLLRDLVDCWWK